MTSERPTATTTDPWSNLDRIPRSGVLGLAVFLTQIILLPIRAVTIVLLLVGTFLWISFITMFTKMKLNEPLPRIQAALIKFGVMISARLTLLTCGIVHVNTIDLRDADAKTTPMPNLMISNHGSILDMFVAMYLFNPCIVAKSTITKIPFVGGVAKGMQCVFVDRNSEESRKKTLELMKDRATNTKFPPCLVYPEGTRTNGSSLIRFQAGSFRLGVPIQPIAVDYKWQWVNPNTVERSYVPHLIRLIRNTWYFTVDVYIMQPHFPTEEEQSDAVMYANNIQAEMAKVMNRPISTQTMYDNPLGHIKKRKAEKQD